MGTRKLERISLSAVRRGAYIFGEASGYAYALRDYEQRIAAGWAAEFYTEGSYLIVGDPIPDDPPAPVSPSGRRGVV